MVESALADTIEILSDENLMFELTPAQIEAIDNYDSINLGGKDYFKVGSGKPPAGILRISKKLEREDQTKVLDKLVDAKQSLDLLATLGKKD